MTQPVNEPAEQAAPHLLVVKDGHVLTITMNRPKVRNAMGLEMLARLADAWDLLDADDELRVAILTGAEGVFSSGADLKAMHGSSADDPWAKRFADEPSLHWKAFLRDHRPRKPVLSAIEGIAFGGGTEIIQGTDIRIAGRSARFGITESKFGLFPLGGSTVRLPRQVTFTKAMEMLLTAQPIDAEEAYRIGLVGTLVDDGSALDKAREMAGHIAANGPLAVQAIKQSAWEAWGKPQPEALARELELGWPVFQSKDAREGTRAFAEKRAPVFKGEW